MAQREKAEAWSGKALRVLTLAAQRLNSDIREATGIDEPHPLG